MCAIFVFCDTTEIRDRRVIGNTSIMTSLYFEHVTWNASPFQKGLHPSTEAPRLIKTSLYGQVVGVTGLPDRDNKLPIVPHRRCTLKVTVTHLRNMGLSQRELYLNIALPDSLININS